MEAAQLSTPEVLSGARLKHGYSRVRYGRCRHFPVSFTARSRPGGSVTVVTLRHSSQS
ncbi:hypothetical protein AI2850V1_1690 [Klebsiella pneumoniae]|nr:hypothetical protein AI2850V1_1690 [Klebsiella pneumoniae]CAH5169015.1 hypothetical protein AI2850V1_1690 [Klebsiella pneumoniae]